MDLARDHILTTLVSTQRTPTSSASSTTANALRSPPTFHASKYSRAATPNSSQRTSKVFLPFQATTCRSRAPVRARRISWRPALRPFPKQGVDQASVRHQSRGGWKEALNLLYLPGRQDRTCYHLRSCRVRLHEGPGQRVHSRPTRPAVR